MVLKPAPFTRTRLDEEKVNDRERVLSLKLNREEDAELEADMRLLDCGVDSKAIKLLVNIGREVIRRPEMKALLEYTASQKRTRYDGRKR